MRVRGRPALTARLLARAFLPTMKLHAAMFALMGWILLVPPWVCPESVPSCVSDLNAPLNKWLYQGYFATAER